MAKQEEIKQTNPEVEIDENVAELSVKVEDELKISEEDFKNLNEVGLEAISGQEDLSKEEKIETIKDNAGKWDRVKIFTREIFSGKDSEKRKKTYEKVTEKIINKELENLEKDGNKVVDKKNGAKIEEGKLKKELEELRLNKEKFKNTTGVDLENVKKGMESSKKFNPEKFNEYDAKYKEELTSHENLISGKEEALAGHNDKSAEELENLKTGLNLKERVNQFEEPAGRKMEKLNGFEEKYSGLLDEAQTERKNYENKVKGLEKILKGFKGDSDLSQDMKKDIQAELDIEKENLKKLKEAEDKLKSRLETIKANKKETSDFIFKMECIGKTPEEIKATKKDKQEQEKEKSAQTSAKSDAKSDISKQTAGGGGEKNKSAVASVEDADDLEDSREKVSGETEEPTKKFSGKGKEGKTKNVASVSETEEIEVTPNAKKEKIIKTKEEWAEKLLLDPKDNNDYRELCNAARQHSKDKKTLLETYDDEKMYSIYLTYLKNKKINNAKEMAEDKFNEIKKQELNK